MVNGCLAVGRLVGVVELKGFLLGRTNAFVVQPRSLGLPRTRVLKIIACMVGYHILNEPQTGTFELGG